MASVKNEIGLEKKKPRRVQIISHFVRNGQNSYDFVNTMIYRVEQNSTYNKSTEEKLSNYCSSCF